MSPRKEIIGDAELWLGDCQELLPSLDRACVGIEREPAYFDIACRRIEEAYRQPRLFEEPAPKPVQGSLLGGAS